MKTRIQFGRRLRGWWGLALLGWFHPFEANSADVQFNRDIRPILSNRCFACHGPDDAKRQGGGKDGLRLDQFSGATRDLGGYAAIKPGNPEESELMVRILSDDPDEVMPPAKTGERLTSSEIEKLRAWIASGAPYEGHWAYAPQKKPLIPTVTQTEWPSNPIDFFILNRLESEGLAPSHQANKSILARRAALDLTGLPPSTEMLDSFLKDTQVGSYERYIDALLNSKAFGEHWARFWLDKARYADSAGYADDPPRTIWAYRDYVVRSFNDNKAFSDFTIEQIAGDLLPNPTEEQIIATAFHRNTMTNNEGGTNNEEFRNVAVVDRVNTTYEVWMGTTMACAQCHNHKYDPISQEDYFKSFAIFNNTRDADLTDESPTLPLYSEDQLKAMARLKTEISEKNRRLTRFTTELENGFQQWQDRATTGLRWETLRPISVSTQPSDEIEIQSDGLNQVDRKAPSDTYQATLIEDPSKSIHAVQLAIVPRPNPPDSGKGQASGNAVINRIRARLKPSQPHSASISGRFIRIEAPGDGRILSLAEVQILAQSTNIALSGKARQSSTDYNGEASRANDGNTNGDYFAANSTTHTKNSKDPWWELDLGDVKAFDQIRVWNRTDGNIQNRLSPFRVKILDENQKEIWVKEFQTIPDPDFTIEFDGSREIVFKSVFADVTREGFDPASVIQGPNAKEKGKGWALAPELDKEHYLALVPSVPIIIPPDQHLELIIEHSTDPNIPGLSSFRIRSTTDPDAERILSIPKGVQQILLTKKADRTPAEIDEIREYYLKTTPLLEGERKSLAALNAELESIKPMTTVPVMRENSDRDRRTTHIQNRGNFMDKGKEVTPGLPAFLSPGPEKSPPTRLDLARWLVNRENPLTARVTVNRFWESIFGTGLVGTSEDFGMQGDLPTHPELLDWLSVEFMDQGWNVKSLLKWMVTSSTYKQSSAVNDTILEKDPQNRLLSRGPRFRLPAETIRDQALYVAGLLSPKLYGPPVKPPQPQLGLSAAFGGGIDWETSKGEDQYRRGLYTTWRRSNPYPSMSAFDAPNREVCIVKRDRTNTPLQALVTLNDPVYIEAAQGLAHRMLDSAESTKERLIQGFKICLTRPPSDAELRQLEVLLEESLDHFEKHPESASQFIQTSANVFSETPKDPIETAAWTVLGNVLLNLDEVIMKL